MGSLFPRAFSDLALVTSSLLLNDRNFGRKSISFAPLSPRDMVPKELSKHFLRRLKFESCSGSFEKEYLILIHR